MNTETTKTHETLRPGKVYFDEVYFDEDCPMCRNLAAHYGTPAESERTRFVPLQAEGVIDATRATRDDLMLLMHIRTYDGRILNGAEGVVHLLSRRWWGSPLARLFKLPGAMPLARIAYGLVARNRLRLSAALVSIPWWLPAVWLLTSAVLISILPTFGIIEFLLLLAPMALVPSLVGLNPVRKNQQAFSMVEALPFVLASFPVVASFLLSKGFWAAALILPWVVVAGLRTSRWLWSLKALFDPASPTEATLWVDAAADAFLMVGVTQLFTSRLGFPSLGFSEEIILLTAVHFHFSGFITLNLASIVGRKLAGPGACYPPLLIAGMDGLILSVPLIALGFFVSVTLKVIGVMILVLAVFCLSLSILALAFRSSGLARALLILSALSPVAGISLSMIYVAGEFAGREILSIPTMAATHGILNGIGFCLCGLFGLMAIRSDAEKQS